MLPRPVLALAALTACLDPTEITVVVTTDVPCASLKGTTVRVASSVSSGDAAVSQPACDAQGRVGSVVLLPNDAQSGATVEVITGVGESPEQCERDGFSGGCILARRSVSFVNHSRLTLPIEMRRSCLNLACSATTTCVDGACIPTEQASGGHTVADAAADVTTDATSGKVVQLVGATGYTAAGGEVLTMPVPPGTQPGDRLVLALLTKGNFARPGAPWTLYTSASDVDSLEVRTRPAVVNEVATVLDLSTSGPTI